jgi:hypothetical protein
VKFTLIIQNIGTWQIDRPDHFNGYRVPNVAHVCPACLRLWSHIYAAGNGYYSIQSAPCEDCWVAASELLAPVPGSIINSWTGLGGIDSDLLDALPADLLQRELALTIEAMEKWMKPRHYQALTSSSKDQQEQAKHMLSEQWPTLE